MRNLTQRRVPVRPCKVALASCVLGGLLGGGAAARAQATGGPAAVHDPANTGVATVAAEASAGGTSASGAALGAASGAGPEAGSGVSAVAAAQARGPSCTVEGTIHGSDGGIVPGASLSLQGEGLVDKHTASSDADGDYLLDNLPCGQFVLTAEMPGFTTLVVSGELQDAGEVLRKDLTLKIAGVNSSVNVVATRAEIAQAQIKLQEHQRMAGMVPNFFVSYQWTAEPLRPKQKFELAERTAIDPANLVLAGVFAGVQQANNDLPGYGQGAAGYGKRFGANVGNLVTGTFLGGAILPTIFRQDPRYFYRGTGSKGSRLFYAVSRAFVTRGDNGHQQVNFSGILGDLGSGAISNLYADKQDRNGAGLTISNGLLAVAGDCVNNTLQEFVLRKLTTKTKGRRGKATDGTTAP